MPQTVLYIHHSNDLYGADVMLVETLRRLDPTRFRPIVILPQDAYSISGLGALLESEGIEILWLQLAVVRRKYLRWSHAPRYIVDFVNATLGVRHIIRSRHVSLVHSNTLAVLAGALGAWLSGVPHLWHVHEILQSPALFRRVLHAASIKLPTITLCISDSVRNNLLEDEPNASEQIRVIHNGLPLERFVPTEDRATIRLRLGLPINGIIVGMVGRINQWKGQGVFVQAATILRERFPDILFLIVGSVFSNEVHHLTELNAEIQRCGMTDQIKILNFRTDVPDLLAAMDIYVHPSILAEPFGLSIIEAMACGLPVVASAPGGPSEIIENGVSGLLVTPGSPEEVCDALTSLLIDRPTRIQMGFAARQHVFLYFHIERYILELQQLYVELLSNDSRTGAFDKFSSKSLLK